ncbi:hypothetical protein [Paramicrobacterium humi]|nr:hypothetical protein [Microbacterium humi]
MLDLTRVSGGVGLVGEPEYPIVVVKREHAVPENIAVCAALLIVHRELDLAREFIPKARRGGPEYVAAVRLNEVVQRMLRQPWLAGIRDEALNAIRRGSIESVADAANGRVVAGHTTSPTAYKRVVDWLIASLEGAPTEVGGEIDWSYYGSDFDETLFELWCLEQIRERMSARYGGERNEWIYGDPQPVFGSDDTPNGTRLSLYVQSGLRKTLNIEPRWRSVESSRKNAKSRLGGVPDYLVVGSEGQHVILDAKLRDRSRRPTEEIYKLLGYFNNFAHQDPTFGVILYYAKSPRVPAYEMFETAEGGQILAFSVDPERPDGNEEGWTALLNLLDRVC